MFLPLWGIDRNENGSIGLFGLNADAASMYAARRNPGDFLVFDQFSHEGSPFGPILRS